MPDVASTPEAPPARACHHCGAQLDERQQICVECGAATTAGRPRAARLARALKPLSLSAFAALVVTSVAYGLTASAGRDSGNLGAVAVAPKPPAATTPAPAPAPAPTTPAPETPAPEATTTTLAPEPKPPSSPADPAPKPPATPEPPSPSPAPTPPAPQHTGGSPATHEPSGSGSGSAHARPRHHHHSAPNPDWTSQGDQPYSAALYDPYEDGSDEHANQAHRAVDGNRKTAWTTADHPDGLGKPGVGLVVEASGFQSYSALGLETKTPGYSVEVYSTTESDPPAGGPDQPGWTREGGAANVKKQQRIRLKGGNANPQYLLVWITKLPARTPRAGISEISLLP